MSLKDKNGKLVMIDDARFDPIIDFIVKNNIPLVGHLGEPKNYWLPLDKMTTKGDRSYFKENPKYHMYLHPEFPSNEDVGWRKYAAWLCVLAYLCLRKQKF